PRRPPRGRTRGPSQASGLAGRCRGRRPRESVPGRESASGSFPCGRCFEPYLDATRVGSLDRERRSDQQRALAHAAQPSTSGGYLAVEAAPIVDHAQDDALPTRLERKPDPARLRMPGDVREALLSNPVHRQLHIRVQRRQLAREVLLELETGALGDARRERLQRARESEVLEQLRPELLRDSTYLVDAAPRGLLPLGEQLPPFRPKLARHLFP